jgi:hypothetical protein
VQFAFGDQKRGGDNFDVKSFGANHGWDSSTRVTTQEDALQHGFVVHLISQSMHTNSI